MVCGIRNTCRAESQSIWCFVRKWCSAMWLLIWSPCLVARLCSVSHVHARRFLPVSPMYVAWQSQHLILYTAPCLSFGLSLSLLTYLLTRSSKTNYERTTGELTIFISLTIDDYLTVATDGSKHTNYWLQVFIANNLTDRRPITSWCNWPIRSITRV